MVSSDQLIQELPKLRRYARALCGTQTRGDELVTAVLQRISENPGQLRADVPIRLSLFRAFTQDWVSTFGQGSRLGDITDEVVPDSDLSLALMTPAARQAFLLTSLEGFSVDDVAVILDQDAASVDQLIEQARAEIAEQTSTSVLIIEDELFIATQLEQIAKKLGHVVVGLARTRTEVNKVIDDLNANLIRPGIVLADVQLADGSSGIDAVNDILTQMSIPIIFITAFPERLLTGRAIEPTYLLNKPFTSEGVMALMTQALFFRRTQKPL